MHHGVHLAVRQAQTAALHEELVEPGLGLLEVAGMKQPERAHALVVPEGLRAAQEPRDAPEVLQDRVGPGDVPELQERAVASPFDLARAARVEAQDLGGDGEGVFDVVRTGEHVKARDERLGQVPRRLRARARAPRRAG